MIDVRGLINRLSSYAAAGRGQFSPQNIICKEAADALAAQAAEIERLREMTRIPERDDEALVEVAADALPRESTIGDPRPLARAVLAALRGAGRSYPRTCPTCRLGPCSGGHDYKSMREQIATQAAEIERLTRERERLALAICGGEDAPGYANAQTVETLEGVARDSRGRRNYDMDRATAAEAEAGRLRVALNRIALMGSSDDPAVCSAIAYHAVKRARAALTERKP